LGHKQRKDKLCGLVKYEDDSKQALMGPGNGPGN
ncbi:hypothetical protein CCACVL1_03325, partial [Corchorus capsularis]